MINFKITGLGRTAIVHTFIVLFFLASFNTGTAQVTKFHVNYVGQIATERDLDQYKSTLSLLTDFIFGDVTSKLRKPISLYIKDSTNMWVVDQGSNCIMCINKEENIFNTLDCEKIIFASLVGICKTNSDTILFSDSKLGKLFYFREGQQSIHSFSHRLNLSKPTGMAFNPKTKNIWLVETGKHRILLLTSDGKIKKTIGSYGTDKGQFNYPGFIWIDKEGTAFIVDSMNFRIQIFDAEGNFISMFGQAGDASGFFARPKGIATDSYGNIYVVDALFNAIQIFDRAGNFLYSFGHKGTGQSEFLLPSGIYINETDRIYIADSYNARIQIFELSMESDFEKSIKN